jgi:hypothetical protein
MKQVCPLWFLHRRFVYSVPAAVPVFPTVRTRELGEHTGTATVFVAEAGSAPPTRSRNPDTIIPATPVLTAFDNKLI